MLFLHVLKQLTMHTCEDCRQIGRMKHVFLLIYTVGALLFSVNGICLTWNATADNVFIKCHVFSNFTAEHEILLMDSFHKLRTKCYNYGSPYCRGRENWDIIMDESTENGFSFVLQTAKKNVEGEWKCSHGSDKANVYIHLMKGTVYSVDTHLTGEVVEKTAYNKKFKLTCYSCWAPDTESANFFVNDVLEDSIRYKDGNCYRKRNLCNLSECTCSNKGKHFTWNFISNLSFIELSCEMRFTDEETSNFSIQTANIMYNESGFQQKVTTKKIISASDKDIYSDTTNADQSLPFIAVVAFTSTVTINVILIGTWVGCTLFLKKIRPDVKTTHTLCDTCKSSLVCEVCIDCCQRLCDSCCVHHNKLNQDHRVCQVQHIALCKVKIDCTECNLKPADIVCIECCTPHCKSCGFCLTHGEIAMKEIYEGTLDSTVKSTETVNKFLEETETILVPENEGKFPVRICGMAFLENGTLTVADTNNNNLIVFHPQNRLNVLTKMLQDQPRSITSMTGSEIAITFPYDQKIQIYKIILDENENTMKVEEVKKIYLPDIGLPNQRPYSITFDNLNKGFFAVEVGEGVDGIIAIIENNETNFITHKISPNAFFTGHTIHLALDMSNGGKLFISSLGTKMVSCIDLDSNEQWSTSIPSPRSIILIPEEYNPGKRIILSSRRCNAIYGLSHETGKSDILLGKKSPRYIAYYEKEKKLCVQVEKSTNKDMLVIFELKFPEKIESTIPLL